MVLLIYAHPTKNGHNALILEEVQRQLPKNNIDIIDLYKEGYNPVLQKQELVSRLKKPSADIKKYQDLIKKHNSIIIIAPVWWNGVPAILKGFFDRVFTPNFGFKYKKLPFSLLGMVARPVPLLKGKKAVVFLTTGAPKFTGWLFMKHRAHKVLVKDTLGFCGIRGKACTLGNCKDNYEARKFEIKELVHKGLHFF